jgi:hypothetical protein
MKLNTQHESTHDKKSNNTKDIKKMELMRSHTYLLKFGEDKWSQYESFDDDEHIKCRRRWQCQNVNNANNVENRGGGGG